MKSEMSSNGTQWETALRIAPWAGAAGLLILPLIAMRFDSGVVWTLSDFIIAGILLFGAAGLFELAMRARGDFLYRAASALGVGTSLFLIWAILAVGLIGDSGDAPDLMYGAVFVIGIAGAMLSRLKPRGMARTLFAMAAAQAFIGLAAIAGGFVPAYNTNAEIVGITMMFVILFTASGALFHIAAFRQNRARSK